MIQWNGNILTYQGLPLGRRTSGGRAVRLNCQYSQLQDAGFTVESAAAVYQSMTSIVAELHSQGLEVYGVPYCYDTQRVRGMLERAYGQKKPQKSQVRSRKAAKIRQHQPEGGSDA